MSEIRDLSEVPVSQMRAAAATWRASRGRWENTSTFDRIDDLIDEIERLRASLSEGKP